MLDPICQNSKGQSFCLIDRLLLSPTIGHDSRKAGNLRKPAPVVLSLDFDSDRHVQEISTESRHTRRVEIFVAKPDACDLRHESSRRNLWLPPWRGE
jgi:hypothetical protein